jgi:hypothetical protein
LHGFIVLVDVDAVVVLFVVGIVVVKVVVIVVVEGDVVEVVVVVVYGILRQFSTASSAQSCRRW